VKRLLQKLKEKIAEFTSPKKKTSRPRLEPVKDKQQNQRKADPVARKQNTERHKESSPQNRQRQSQPNAKQGTSFNNQRDNKQQRNPGTQRTRDGQQVKRQAPEKTQPGQERQTGQGQERQPRQDRPQRQERQPRQPRIATVPAPKPIPAEPWDPASFTVEPVEGKKRFHDFDLPVEVMHAISELGFKYCTPIQAEILSKTLSGKDASGKAQTGTGKTAAFLITIFSNFIRKPLETRKTGSPRALIMAPTRELVVQIANDAKILSKHTGVKVLSVVGGMDYQKQKRSLTGVIDVIVATPGRLLDFYSKHDLNLREVEILVIDEADRMMDMGFIPDMRKIIRATPHKEKRQTLLFSATLPPEVLRLASSWTTDSEVVDVEPDHVEGKNVEQITYIISNDEKYPLLYNTIVKKNLNRVIVFTNRRDEAKKVKDMLFANGLNTDVLSGDVDQRKRMRTLSDFKEGKINILVATDVAGRGIHIAGISHVINYNLPEDPEDYVHRIGRTGRAGAAGISISFACEDDSFQIPAIEEYLGHKLEFSHPDDELLAPVPEPVRAAEPEEVKTEQPGEKKKFNNNYRRNNYNRRGRSGNYHRKNNDGGKPGGEKPTE
jgi:ATP-dependent RNA helicase RhlB